jgi:hypothetical protein
MKSTNLGFAALWFAVGSVAFAQGGWFGFACVAVGCLWLLAGVWPR